eukprot:2800605-Rhodomonas_salina.2
MWLARKGAPDLLSCCSAVGNGMNLGAGNVISGAASFATDSSAPAANSVSVAADVVTMRTNGCRPEP